MTFLGIPVTWLDLTPFVFIIMMALLPNDRKVKPTQDGSE